jgi:DNA-binding transcriptional ArsR family regulator
MRDKEWLDASIRHWVRIQQLVDRRVELLRELRAQLDMDLADLLRELDSDSVTPSERKVDDNGQASSVSKVSDTSEPSNTSKVDDESKVDNLVTPPTQQESKLLKSENEVRARLTNLAAPKKKNRERQVRGDWNPNRLLILKLTRTTPMTVPELQRELSSRIGKLSKQSVDNWVKKLLEEGLLSREDSPDSISKNRYRRTDKIDEAEQGG